MRALCVKLASRAPFKKCLKFCAISGAVQITGPLYYALKVISWFAAETGMLEVSTKFKREVVGIALCALSDMLKVFSLLGSPVRFTSKGGQSEARARNIKTMFVRSSSGLVPACVQMPMQPLF